MYNSKVIFLLAEEEANEEIIYLLNPMYDFTFCIIFNPLPGWENKYASDGFIGVVVHTPINYLLILQFAKCLKYMKYFLKYKTNFQKT